MKRISGEQGRYHLNVVCLWVCVCNAASSFWHGKQHSSCTKSFYVLVCSSVIALNSFTFEISSELRKETERPCVRSKSGTLEMSANHKIPVRSIW